MARALLAALHAAASSAGPEPFMSTLACPSASLAPSCGAVSLALAVAAVALGPTPASANRAGPRVRPGAAQAGSRAAVRGNAGNVARRGTTFSKAKVARAALGRQALSVAPDAAVADALRSLRWGRPILPGALERAADALRAKHVEATRAGTARGAAHLPPPLRKELSERDIELLQEVRRDATILAKALEAARPRLAARGGVATAREATAAYEKVTLLLTGHDSLVFDSRERTRIALRFLEGLGATVSRATALPRSEARAELLRAEPALRYAVEALSSGHPKAFAVGKELFEVALRLAAREPAGPSRAGLLQMAELARIHVADFATNGSPEAATVVPDAAGLKARIEAVRAR